VPPDYQRILCKVLDFALHGAVDMYELHNDEGAFHFRYIMHRTFLVSQGEESASENERFWDLL
jgi:hypothetical protein